MSEAILMSTHNICFYEELTKFIIQLSSNIIKYAPYLFSGCSIMLRRPCNLDTKPHLYVIKLRFTVVYTCVYLFFPYSRSTHINRLNKTSIHNLCFEQNKKILEFIIRKLLFSAVKSNYIANNRRVYEILLLSFW